MKLPCINVEDAPKKGGVMSTKMIVHGF